MGKDKYGARPARQQDPGKFDFFKMGTPFAILSVVISLIALGDILREGFDYGIDFAGGTEVQVQFNDQVTSGKVRDFTKAIGFDNASVQAIGEDNEFLIRMDMIQGKDDKETQQKVNAVIQKITSGLATSFENQGAAIRRVDSVGPQIGEELKRNGVLAVFYSLLMILIYIGLRFDYKYAPGAVFCLFHDAVIVLGIFAIFDFEVNVQTLAAVLTIIGYSLNDTIVTFDRIRENVKVYRDQNFKWVSNRSINDVLSRTLLTSITTLIAVSAMYFIAGGVIKDFAFTLGLGVIIGTYSSIYVATPLVIFADRFTESGKKNLETAPA
jgi:preprotein translocase subunit SecF